MQNNEEAKQALEEVLLELQASASIIQNTIQFLNNNTTTMGYTEQEIIDIIKKGEPNGVAPLNSSGIIDTAYLPENDFAAFVFAFYATITGYDASQSQVLVKENSAYRWVNSSDFLSGTGGGGSTDGTTYHLSNFTAANGTALPSYTPETGSAWANTWGTWEIQGGKATTLTMRSGNNDIALTPLAHSDYTANITATVLSQNLQFWFRTTLTSGNPTDGIIVIVSPTDVQLYNQVSEVVTQFGSFSFSNGGTAHVYTTVLSGTSIIVKVDGITKITTTVPTTQTGMNIGFGGDGTPTLQQVQIDKVEVTN